MRILTADEMRRFDRWAIETVGIPSLVLMENAALGVADAVGERYPGVREVGVLCGPGNNGADGLAVARLLDARGYHCRVLLGAPPDRYGGDAGAQLEICRRLGIAIATGDPEAALPPVDLWIDALFGTGLDRPLEGSFAAWVGRLADQPAPVVAVDIPSGLDASRAEVIGPRVIADLTVTFAAPKVAHILAPAADAVGVLVVADLGVAYRDLEGSPPPLHLLRVEELSGWLLPRPADAHKGRFGHLLVVAGSRGMSGAAMLATRGALRSGAGLVTLAVPESIRAEVANAVPEAMTVGLADAGSGRFAPGHLERLTEVAAGKAALAVGPGLGRADDTGALVRELVAAWPGPLVLDADALAAFAGQSERLAGRSSLAVLTPHAGELARLSGGITAAQVTADRLEAVRAAARSSGSVTVLKGQSSLIAAPDGEVWINPTGNPGLATGGSGDVLCGLTGGLLAQGYEPDAAAAIGVFWHGLAADLLAAERGPLGWIAGDLAELLPEAYRHLVGAAELERWRTREAG